MNSARQSSTFALLLLFAVAGFITPAAAQQEVQIMVNGPWAYAPGSSSSSLPTIFIVAPILNDHGPVVVFTGEDANTFPTAANRLPIPSPGIYALTIPGIQTTCGGLTIKSTEVPQRAYQLRGIATDVIAAAVDGSKGYVISLPKPCYYTTLVDNYSRIDPVSPTRSEGNYTTWMVLHYLVSNPDRVKINGIDVFLKHNNPIKPLTVSIALGPTTLYDTDLTCDSGSVSSFRAEASLFFKDPLKNLHVHFPRLILQSGSGTGVQTHDYIPGCEDKPSPMTFLHLLNDISTIEFYLNSPRDDKKPGARTAAQELHDTVLTLKSVPADVTEELNKLASLFELQSSTGTHSAQRISPAQGDSGAHLTATRPFLETQRTAAGAGDCRGAQISINDTVQ